MSADGSLPVGGLVFGLMGSFAYFISDGMRKQALSVKNAVKVSNFKDIDTLKTQLPLLVALSGRVGTDTPIPCQLKQESKAVFAQLQEIHKQKKQLFDGQWLGDDSIVSISTKRAEVMYMEDGLGRRVPVRWPGLETSPNVEQVTQTFQPAKTQLVGDLIDKFRGIRVLGIQKIERAVLVGQSATAIGELAAYEVDQSVSITSGLTWQDGKCIVLQKPKSGPFRLTNDGLDEVYRQMSAGSAAFKYIAYSLWMVGTILIARRLYRKLRKELQKRRARQEMKRLQAEQQRQIDVSGERGYQLPLCAICMDRPQSAVFVKCGHMSTCFVCSVDLTTCPICRKPGQVIRVFPQ